MLRTLRLSALALLTLAAGLAQTVDTVAFHATMTTDQEVPAVTGVTGAGLGTLFLHINRNASGAITSGVADFDLNFTLVGAIDLTGFHIHNAPAGQNSGVVIGTDLSGTNRVPHPGGAGRVIRQVVVTDAALLSSVLARPDQFYMNLHTVNNPGGVMRGQLQPAELRVFRAALSPQNEVPPIAGLDASGSCNVVTTAVRDAGGQIIGGAALFDVNYRFANPASLQGLHIHNGPAGVNAGVVIGTDLSAANNIPNVTTGNVNRAVPILTPVQLTNFRGLYATPAGFYCNMHTSVNAGGAIRGQMQPTGEVTLRMVMGPDKEVPAVTGLQASAVASFRAYVVRNGAGQIISGTAVFVVNHQFPGPTEFTGLSIHRGAEVANGGIVLESGVSPANPVQSTGTGSITRIVNIDADNPSALAALNEVAANPGGFYLNLSTRVNAGGAVRGQMGLAAANPQINASGIISATQDIAIAPASPGSIISIYGTNLAGTTSDTSGVEIAGLPIGLNGAEVRIAGRQAPLFFVSPFQINAQVPYEVEPGAAQVFVVRQGQFFSAPYSLTVGRVSPGIFVNSLGAAVLKNIDFTQVSASNPAAAGDILSIFGTGLGEVTPRLPSGLFAPILPFSLTVAQPSVTVGGRDADVVASSLAPGFAGLYQVAIRMPAGVGSGNQPVVLTVGGARSNAAMMAVR